MSDTPSSPSSSKSQPAEAESQKDPTVKISSEKTENTATTTDNTTGQKKKLSKGQKKRLAQKRKYKRERMQQTADLTINGMADFHSTSLGKNLKNQTAYKSTAEATIKDRKKNAHKAGFEQVLGDHAKGYKQFDSGIWYKRVPKSKREEWLINCYRMRVDDDNRWGGGYMHGLSEVSCDYAGAYGGDIKGEIMKKNVIVKDFLKFMILAHENKGYPMDENEFRSRKCWKSLQPC